jgi:hypothetical protein
MPELRTRSIDYLLSLLINNIYESLGRIPIDSDPTGVRCVHGMVSVTASRARGVRAEDCADLELSLQNPAGRAACGLGSPLRFGFRPWFM